MCVCRKWFAVRVCVCCDVRMSRFKSRTPESANTHAHISQSINLTRECAHTFHMHSAAAAATATARCAVEFASSCARTHARRWRAHIECSRGDAVQRSVNRRRRCRTQLCAVLKLARARAQRSTDRTGTDGRADGRQRRQLRQTEGAHTHERARERYADGSWRGHIFAASSSSGGCGGDGGGWRVTQLACACTSAYPT